MWRDQISPLNMTVGYWCLNYESRRQLPTGNWQPKALAEAGVGAAARQMQRLVARKIVNVRFGTGK